MDIHDQIRQFIVTQILRNPKYKLSNDESMIKGGLIDSFSLAEVGIFLEKTFAIKVPDSDLTADAMDTIDQIAAYVAAKRT
jgi:acyl carrier protein